MRYKKGNLMDCKQKRMGIVGCFGQIENIKRQSLWYPRKEHHRCRCRTRPTCKNSTQNRVVRWQYEKIILSSPNQAWNVNSSGWLSPKCLGGHRRNPQLHFWLPFTVPFSLSTLASAGRWIKTPSARIFASAYILPLTLIRICPLCPLVDGVDRVDKSGHR